VLNTKRIPENEAKAILEKNFPEMIKDTSLQN
jgi:hypothetical protein